MAQAHPLRRSVRPDVRVGRLDHDLSPQRALPGWLLAGTLGLANSGEVIWVSMQQWRGVPSHFNFETAFDAAAFSVGGAGLIFFTGVVIVAVTLWTFVSLDAPPSIAVAIRAGLILLVAAQVFGGLIIQNGIAKVLDPQTGEFLSEGLESASLFGQAGMMKIPHGLALHAIQALPVLVLLLLFTGWGREPAHPRCPRRNRRGTWGCSPLALCRHSPAAPPLI